MIKCEHHKHKLVAHRKFGCATFVYTRPTHFTAKEMSAVTAEDPSPGTDRNTTDISESRVTLEGDGVKRISIGGPVKPRGIDLHFLPLGENRGSPPSSRRRQQSTGLLHLYLQIPVHHRKSTTFWVVLFLWWS